MADKKVDRSDGVIFRALKRAAKLVREEGSLTGSSDGHRMSETYCPARCARCGGNWPCGSERKARNFDTLAKAVAAAPLASAEGQ